MRQYPETQISTMQSKRDICHIGTWPKMEQSLQAMSKQERLENWADWVYIDCVYTDLRREIDGPAATVQQQFNLDSYTNTLLLFCALCG